MKLSGLKALVTGVTGGLGRVISKTQAQIGADLILVDRPGSNIEVLANGISERWGTKVKYKYCDLEDQTLRGELISCLRDGNKDLIFL